LSHQIKVLLIDADSRIPNLALMKLSRYYKDKYWAKVKLIKLNLPYYPDRKKQVFDIDTSEYDFSFCSVVFEGNSHCVKGNNITFGGTGFDYHVYLPKEIDDCEPDYSIYHPEFVDNTSYGFLSRGCIRKCEFCKVHVVEGKLTRYRNVDDVVRHSKVKFLDNNFLALPEHKEILQELIDKNIKCQFNQGLDIRLVDSENSLLLSKLNYLHEYIFAFDNIKYKDNVEKQLELLYWRKAWQLKFFVYVHPKMELFETISRIVWLKERECLPYLMRHIDCWGSEYNKFYIDLAAYCNQVFAFKKLSFDEFLKRRHVNKERVRFSSELWNSNI